MSATIITLKVIVLDLNQRIRGARPHIGHASRVPPQLLILQFLNYMYNVVFDLSCPSLFSNLNIYLSIFGSITMS